MTQEHILKNAATCLVCDDTIESKSRNDFVTCSCGNLFVDGGLVYLRRGCVSDRWEEKSVTLIVGTGLVYH